MYLFQEHGKNTVTYEHKHKQKIVTDPLFNTKQESVPFIQRNMI